MLKHRARAVFLVIFAVVIGYVVYASEQPGSTHPFRLGLDLSGGTHLVYRADVSKISPSDISDSMSSLRDVVERRVNLFGVSEPLVQTEEGVALSADDAAYRLIIELPGVTNVEDAVRSIGATPRLEFRLAQASAIQSFDASTATTSITENAAFLGLFKETGLTGSMVNRSTLEFNPTTNEPAVSLVFSSEGRDLFGSITEDNIGNYLGIFLDGKLISYPVLRDAILDGRAQISGSFTVDEAKSLVRDLNYGALPIPITLISSQTIGPSLGQAAVKGGIKAGIISFVVIALFLIIWYRLPGVIATVALAIYIILNLAIFKIGVSPAVIILCVIFVFLALKSHWVFGLIAIGLYALMALIPGSLSPVTLTSTGIAAFILSIGMAVDANILIFERMKEELVRGRDISTAMREGFARAWLSIRDSNASSIITGAILYYFGSTSVITGFALVFIIGVLVSMFTAITASRLFLYAIAPEKTTRLSRFLISNGFKQ
ncbi:MAG: preprotein translocase subunit SecD [Patescibacteria group bacterium]